MCLCVHARLEHAADWLRGVPPRAHASAELSPDWPERSSWRAVLHNAESVTLVSRREAGLQGTREAGRDSSGWPRFFFFLSLGFHRNAWQVHTWVGREREQSWLRLGNHLLRLLYLGFFLDLMKKHKSAYKQILQQTHTYTSHLHHLTLTHSQHAPPTDNLSSLQTPKPRLKILYH